MVMNMASVWLQGAFQVFGGGGLVATALLFVIVNDVTPQSKS